MPNNAETSAPRSALLLTRPQRGAERFVARLESGLLETTQLCISPLIEIKPLPLDEDLAEYAGVIFSSTNAVRLAEPGDVRPAYCVGDRTRAAAKDFGWQVAETENDADGLVGAILRKRPAGPLIHLAGRHRRGDIAERLTAAGIPTDVRTVYDQVLLPLSAEAQTLLAGKLPVIVPLFSPRTARHFASEAGQAMRAQIVAMSEAVAQSLGPLPVARLHIACAPTAEEMRRCVEMLFREDSLG